MTTEIELSTPTGKRAALNMPYPPGVVDRLTAWTARLPGPTWSFYLLLLVVLIAIINGVTWLRRIPTTQALSNLSATYCFRLVSGLRHRLVASSFHETILGILFKFKLSVP